MTLWQRIKAWWKRRNVVSDHVYEDDDEPGLGV